jgi:hypothetical protein
VVWIAADTLAAAVIWGYYREWTLTTRTAARVEGSLSLESLALG